MSEYSVVNVAGFDVAHRPHTPDEEVIFDTLEAGIFLKGFKEYVILPDHVIIDIGAHIGTYSLQAATLANKGFVYAFEPCLDTFQLLQKNIEINHLPNVKTFKTALTDYIGEAKLYYDLQYGNWGHSITKAFSEEGEVVVTDTLQHFLGEHKIEKVDFIKFNCEGAEFKIILSTPLETFHKIDNMLVLYHMDLEQEFTIDQLVDHLSKAGFYTEIRRVSDEGRRGWLIAMRLTALQRIKMQVKYRLRPFINFGFRVVRKLKRTVTGK